MKQCRTDKKTVWILPYLLIAAVSAVVLLKPFGDGDELWNYNFARCIADGMVPYRDFSIIQTPLSAYIPALFMTVLGRGLLVYRLAGWGLMLSMMMLTYGLCRRITGSGFLAMLAALLLFGLSLPYFVYNYNYLTVLVLLILFFLEREGAPSVRRAALIGFLAGLLPLLKQSTGAVLLLSHILLTAALAVWFRYPRRCVLWRMGMSILPLAVYVCYLLAVGAFDDFWEYAILGIGTFTHRFTPLDLIIKAPVFLVFFVMIGAVYFVILRAIRKNGITQTQLSAVVMASAFASVAYPLCDVHHLVCFLIVLTPVFMLFLKKKTYGNREMRICGTAAAIVTAFSLVVFLPFGEGYMLSTLSNYEGIVISERGNANIEEISSFIAKKTAEGYRVRIADDSAAAYRIPLDLYEKNWDMLLVGNLGSSTVQQLLQCEERCLYLVYRNTDELKMQNHFELIGYIREHYRKIGEVLYFDVYEAVP